MRFLLCALLALPAAGESISAGLSISHALGEQPGAIVFARAQCGLFRAEAFGDTANKIESRSGWRAGLDADLTRRTGTIAPIVGLGYHYRDGGVWSKHSVWPRVGVRLDRSEFIVARNVSGYNDEWSLEVRNRIGKRFYVEPRFGGEVYRNTPSGHRAFGAHLTLTVGIMAAS